MNQKWELWKAVQNERRVNEENTREIENEMNVNKKKACVSVWKEKTTWKNVLISLRIICSVVCLPRLCVGVIHVLYIDCT